MDVRWWMIRDAHEVQGRRSWREWDEEQQAVRVEAEQVIEE